MNEIDARHPTWNGRLARLVDLSRVQPASDADLPRLVDRSRHRTDHLDAVDLAIG